MNTLLKFITCGSVDDGKSTLIGRMLCDAKLIFKEQEAALVEDSKQGSAGDEIDYALLLDGLTAEREQGITIDVAYRYFSTDRRSFIVADTPGHEEYTRNMAVGASFCDLAIILVDATKGILRQTKRHTRICNLMGIRNFVFAINKMDLVNYKKSVFENIRHDIYTLMESFNYQSLFTIPIAASKGDNITRLSINMFWYESIPLLQYLEEVDVAVTATEKPFLMTVQRVSRPDHTFRGFQGQVMQGKLALNDAVYIFPSGETADIKQILLMDKDVVAVDTQQAVTLVLDREVDCSRGCVITKNKKQTIGRLFRANLLWMDDEELLVGRNYLLKVGTKVIPATIIKIHYCVNVNSGKHILQEQAQKNDLINCDVSLSEKVVLDKFNQTPELGRFILINRITNMTAACGVIEHILYRSDNLTWQNLYVTKEIRSLLKNQIPKTIWFTGLSGSGKSTLANALEKMLTILGKHTMLLDGDNIRIGLNNNLGFSEEDRVENIRRIAEVSKLLNDAGIIVLVAAISPFEKDRENAKNIIGKDFVEIYVNTSLEECEKRDTKGLYQKARQGEISKFTGISSPYEVPANPDFIADTQNNSVEEIINQILNYLNY
ncbi:adenylyl-sulfate kinase [Candidatus Epulonipiscium viviparus]|uniref:adenylyl-sulfate kinase n=1 Tax=Candidatus Epulonipiscium viviparus TaxID=420336 RepID=UPI002738144F|nr:adenylyl-sulfate kinase [Candidatus Epulopiscium viviparus]